MTEAEIVAFAQTLEGVAAVQATEAGGAPEAAWGDWFFFAGDDRTMPFATLVVSNYPGFDEASGLDREGVFRLNASVGREGFTELLGYPPSAVPDGLDYAAFDVLLPHPQYAAQSWVSIVCPGEQARALLERAHARARSRQTAGSSSSARSSSGGKPYA
jgi:hypothetical protein